MIEKASTDALRILQDCLRFVLFLEVTRPNLLCEVNETLRLTRLMCVFLTGLLLLLLIVVGYSQLF